MNRSYSNRQFVLQITEGVTKKGAVNPIVGW
jgi:hypothetical protein